MTQMLKTVQWSEIQFFQSRGTTACMVVRYHKDTTPDMYVCLDGCEPIFQGIKEWVRMIVIIVRVRFLVRKILRNAGYGEMQLENDQR